MRTKIKISVSVDEELLCIIDTIVAEGRFRSKSHFIDYAARKLLERT